MGKKDVVGQSGFVIESGGPNGWTIVGAGGLIGVAMVIVAFAIMELATWAGIALIVLAVGQATLNIERGVALIISARNQRAAIEAGVWREVAWQQRRQPPGPNAREDMRELWGE